MLKRSVYLLLLICLASVLSCCSQKEEKSVENQTSHLNNNTEFLELLERIDARDSVFILDIFQNSSIELRAEAVKRAASFTRGSLTKGLIVRLAQDSVESIRADAAFALGQSADVAILPELIFYLEKEKSKLVKRNLLEAIGKCSDSSGLTFLTQYSSTNDSLLYGKMSGIYRAGLKGLQSSESIAWAVSQAIQEDHFSIKLLACQYLARQRRYVTDDRHLEPIATLLKHSLPGVRGAAALALQYHPSSVATDDLMAALNKEEQLLVKVSMIQSLSKRVDRKIFFFFVRLLKEEQAYQTITALSEGICELMSSQDLPAIEEIIKTTSSDVAKTKLLKGVIRYATKDVSHLYFKQLFYSQNQEYLRAECLSALGNHKDMLSLLIELKDSMKGAPFQLNLYEAVSTIQTNSFEELSNEDKKSLLKFWSEGIQINDVAIRGISATALRMDAYKKSAAILLPLLTNSLESIQLPKEIETYQEVLATYRFFEGKEAKYSQYSSKMNAENVNANWRKEWELLASNPVFILETNRGNIRIKMFPNEAPFTTLNIVRLIKEGYYNGKYFHRVVPNFVIQTGCDRGDGWGGVPPVLRSEFSSLNYVPGTVGMASAGPDTESSQFFITHTSTPHLEGRYTIFGVVLSGMEAVQQIRVGDKILQAYMEER